PRAPRATHFPYMTLFRSLWIHIRDRLAEHGIVNKSLRKTESIIDEIVAAVDEDPSLRIILLLDEADYFLNADARNQYRELERIRDRTSTRLNSSHVKSSY